jgi:glycosyltransferase involved in cell wall biosynthesis
MPNSQADGEGAALLSIVVPLFNERENIELLYQGITGVCDGLGRSYEIVMVDDGSTDGTLDILRELHSKDRRVKVVSFRRNFGQTAAMAAGLDYASGDVVVTMDGDLQNDPSDIACLLEKIAEGYDLVAGWRADRKDKFLSRKLPSRIANWLIGKTTGIELHDYGCSLKAYRREVIRNMALYGEMHRFIPALAQRIGASIAEVEVKHHARKYGKSKYGILRTYSVLLDLTTVNFLQRFPSNPLAFFGLLGFLSALAGAVFGGYGILEEYGLGHAGESGLWLLLGTLLLVIAGQFVFLGFCSELILKTGRATRTGLQRIYGRNV